MLLWWSTLRIVNLSWLRLPLFFSLSDCNNKVGGGVIKFKLSTSFSSSPEPEEVSCCSLLDEKDSDDFLPWLERKAGVQISSVLSIGKSAYGRSLLASKSIQTGDCMLRVPDSVQIAPDNLLSEINVLVPDEAANVAKLAMVVIVEQKMGQHSEWAPYISSLPQPGEMHNTIFWSEKEMEMIRQSSVYEETITKNAHIEKDFLVVKPVFDHFPETFGITFDVFQHAYALVESRAWRSTRGVSLIPFADFLNHDGAAEADVVYVDDEGKERSEVIADRNYAPGEQVLIRYGKFSNATLLLDYGFTLPYNIYDEVQIRFNIPQHDPLCMKKLELLHGYRTPTIEDVSGVSSSQDSFTLKEVRSAKGKGRGIPQSLRAFARVLCCSSSQELRDLAGEAAQNDGRLARRPLKNESREIEAHQFLLSRINLLIEEHIMSIQSLDSLTCPVMFGELALRRRMARDLLSESIQVTPEKGANCKGLIMDRRSRSPKWSKDSSPPPPEGRKHSPTPDERSPRERGSPSPRDRAQGNGSEYSGSPKARSRSPMDDESGRESPQRDSPVEENGRSRSPSPIARNRRSSPDDDEDK